MKLYTEEQVNKAMLDYIQGISRFDIFNSLTPIELPSDSLCINCDESKSTHNVCMDCMIKIGKENIELPSDEEIEVALSYRIVEQISFRKGAKWMRDKIQGGNNEQQTKSKNI